MFVAVINENFAVAEEAKKEKQVDKFWETQNAREGKPSWMRVLNPYRWFKANPVTVRVAELPSGLVLPMQKNLVVGYSNTSGTGSNTNTGLGVNRTESMELLGDGAENGMSVKSRATRSVSFILMGCDRMTHRFLEG